MPHCSFTYLLDGDFWIMCDMTGVAWIEYVTMAAVLVVLVGMLLAWCWRWVARMLHRDRIVVRPYYDDHPDGDFVIYPPDRRPHQ